MAGVLAHEIAHIAERHAAAQISKEIIANRLLGLLGAVLGNAGGATTAEAGAQVLAGGYLMTFTREDERAADRLGAAIMQRAGWDPHGLLDFMETLRRQSGRDPSAVEVFFSTHPSPAERIADLRALLAESSVAAGVTARPFTPCTARSRDSLRPSACPYADTESGTPVSGVRYLGCGM